ncbi:MAG: hypothetical protein R6W96_06420 [Clostridia bacterium]
MMNKKPKKKTVIILVIVAVVLLVLILTGVSMIRSIRTTTQGNYEIISVGRGDISYTAVGSGRVTSADVKNAIFSGAVTQSFVSTGDYVKKGDRLCEYTDLQGQTRILTSPHEGVVSAIQPSAYEISGLGQLQMNIQVTEKQVFSMEKGQQAFIFIDALGMEFDGEVSRISMLGRMAGDYSVFDVMVKLNQWNEDIFLGMTGSARICIEKKTDVVIIPLDALIEADGKRYVLQRSWLDNPTRPQSEYYVGIKTGLSDAFFVEVLEGDIDGMEILVSVSSGFPSFPRFFR